MNQADISNKGRSKVATGVYVHKMVAFFISATAEVVHLHYAVVNNYHNFFRVNAYRTHVAATSASFYQHAFVSHFNFQHAAGIDYFNFIYFVVTTNEAQNQAFFRFVSYCFSRFFYRQIEECAYVSNGFAVRSFYFCFFQHSFVSSFDNVHFCFFYVCCVVTLGAVNDFCFTTFSDYHKFMATAATDSTAICFYRTEGQTATVEYVGVSIIHSFVGYVQASFVTVKGVSVFHDEVTATHQTEARTTFITEFILNLVNVHRKLTVGTHVTFNQGGYHFFVGRAKAVFTVMTVFQTNHFCTVSAPTTTFLPNFSRLHDGHHNFLCTSSIHFFTNDVFNFFQYAPCQGQVAVHTVGGFTHETSAQ